MPQNRHDTDLDGAELVTALAEAGWVESEDRSRVFKKPQDREQELAEIFAYMDSSDREEHIGSMSEDDIEELLRQAAAAKTQLRPLGGGWLFAVPGFGASVEDVPAGFVDTDDLDLRFPFSEILRTPSSAVLAIAIDVPHNDGPVEGSWDRYSDTAPGAEDETEEQRLQRRLRLLQGAPARMLAGQLADFAIVVSESDAGLFLDVTARRAGGGGEEQNARFLEMLVLATRFYLGPISPQLDRELGDASIQVGSGEVRARIAVNGATLLDVLEGHAARNKEISELRRRLEELQGS
jgi:hypothetical protein